MCRHLHQMPAHLVILLRFHASSSSTTGAASLGIPRLPILTPLPAKERDGNLVGSVVTFAFRTPSPPARACASADVWPGGWPAYRTPRPGRC